MGRIYLNNPLYPGSKEEGRVRDLPHCYALCLPTVFDPGVSRKHFIANHFEHHRGNHTQDTQSLSTKHYFVSLLPFHYLCLLFLSPSFLPLSFRLPRVCICLNQGVGIPAPIGRASSLALLHYSALLYLGSMLITRSRKLNTRER